MKNKVFNGFLLVLIGFLCFFSCENSSNPSTEENSLKNSFLIEKISWTAYKTTEKIPVNGIFKTIQWKNLKETPALLERLEGASFEIPVDQIDTENPERDNKILLHFFGNLTFGNSIEGENIQIDSENQIVFVDLKINNIIQTISFSFVSKEDGFLFEALLDLKQFQAEKAIAALNTVCENLHKGPDGISFLSENVKVQLFLK